MAISIDFQKILTLGQRTREIVQYRLTGTSTTGDIQLLKTPKWVNPRPVVQANGTGRGNATITTSVSGKTVSITDALTNGSGIIVADSDGPGFSNFGFSGSDSNILLKDHYILPLGYVQREVFVVEVLATGVLTATLESALTNPTYVTSFGNDASHLAHACTIDANKNISFGTGTLALATGLYMIEVDQVNHLARTGSTVTGGVTFIGALVTPLSGINLEVAYLTKGATAGLYRPQMISPRFFQAAEVNVTPAAGVDNSVTVLTTDTTTYDRTAASFTGATEYSLVRLEAYGF